MNPPVTYSIDSDGIGWITLDDPSSKANVFKREVLAGFKEVIRALGKDSSLKAVVIQSAKETIFIAGADLHWMNGIESTQAAFEFARDGQSVLESLTRLKAPVVVAIHGACAGGGYELALACNYRIVSDSPRTQIGLPEISLGLIPGWGGCVRLPRLIGAKGALDHMLKAQLIPAAAAMKAGLVDEIVAPNRLTAAARAAALNLIGQSDETLPATTISDDSNFFAETRKQVLKRTHGHQPAPMHAISVVEQGLRGSIEKALEIEARAFSEVLVTPECKNLIYVFFLRDASKKAGVEAWFPSSVPQSGTSSSADSAFAAPSTQEAASVDKTEGKPSSVLAPPPKPPGIQRVGVVGAGVMGSGIAQWCAMRGFEIVLRDVKSEFVADGMKKIEALFQDGVKRSKLTSEQAGQGIARIKTTTEWDGFDSCDLVIEAVVEDIKVKRPVLEQLSKIMRPDAILATNTSAIPIHEIAAFATHPERVLGIHFFNPVSRMPLVEILLGQRTGRLAAEMAVSFVKTIGKHLVVCKDSPGFLVNRILLPYMNDACRLVMEGVSVGTIDDSLLHFGMPMGPLRLVDEVGVDVCHHIMLEMAHYFGERMIASEALTRLNDAGLKGRKTGKGFYEYEGGKETHNLDLHSIIKNESSPRATSSDEICSRLTGVMIREAKMCLSEGVVRTPEEVDFAMIMGTGFPSFRGGLMRYARSIGTA